MLKYCKVDFYKIFLFLKTKKSDVFHVHSEHEFDLHSEEWIKKIKAKELEMIAWQQANLDTIIPGFLSNRIFNHMIWDHMKLPKRYGRYDMGQII